MRRIFGHILEGQRPKTDCIYIFVDAAPSIDCAAHIVVKVRTGLWAACVRIWKRLAGCISLGEGGEISS